MTKTDKGIELLKQDPFMGVKQAAKQAGIKRDTLKTALSQQGVKVSDLKQQYVKQLESAAPKDFEFKPQLKGDDNMEIVKKSRDWVLGNDKELDEIFGTNYDYMEYRIYEDEIRYLPDGNEPHPIRSDKLSELPEKYINMITGNHADIPVLTDSSDVTIVADTKHGFEQIINLIQEYDEVRHIFDDFNSLVRYTEQQELGKKYEYYATTWPEFREELHNWIANNFAELFDYLDYRDKRKLDEYVINDVFSEKELTEILQDNFPEYWDEVAKGGE